MQLFLGDGGMGGGEELGEGGRRVLNACWEGQQGEDRMRALSIDKLHVMAKSENVAVLLLKIFFQGSRLMGTVCLKGGKGR